MKKRKLGRWILLGLFLAVIIWVAVSSNPFAQGIRQLLGRKPDQPVLNSSFQVAAHSFRYYKFTLPEGSKNMALVGHFAVSIPNGSAGSTAGAQAPATAQSNSSIEVYVMRESAFDSWLKGNASPLIYQSGQVAELIVNQALPNGPGVYYVIFSDKFDPSAAKKVNAALSLHSTSWFSY